MHDDDSVAWIPMWYVDYLCWRWDRQAKKQEQTYEDIETDPATVAELIDDIQGWSARDARTD